MPTGRRQLRSRCCAALRSVADTSGGRKRAKKPYSTHLGTAASAILVVLYMAHRKGLDKMVKDEICDAAEVGDVSFSR